MRNRSLRGVAAALLAVATASALMIPSAAWSDETPTPPTDGSFDGVIVCPPERVQITKDRRLEAGERARAKVKIRFYDGVAPSGDIRLVTRSMDGQVVFKARKPLNAKGAATHRTGELAAGKYKTTATYLPAPESPYARFTRVWWVDVT